MIEIIKTSPLNSIQDLGRFDYRHMGVSVSGVMDASALVAGNIMLGNLREAAGIEIQTYPFDIKFHRNTSIFISGANSRALLDGKAIPPWWGCRVKKGQTLSVRFPKSGCRTYLCVAGGIQVPTVLSSRSTALRGGFGGLDGRYLQTHDQIQLQDNVDVTAFPEDIGIEPPMSALKAFFPETHDGVPILRAIPAGEYELFKAANFWEIPWTISMQSDRTGYRLSGEPLVPAETVEMRSYGLIPGIVQVPPSGEPIIQLSDANTAGGYPKIACVIEEDLWRLGQQLPGSTIQFIPATAKMAADVRDAMDRWLTKLDTMAKHVKSYA